jgi:hypothetical protein
MGSEIRTLGIALIAVCVVVILGVIGHSNGREHYGPPPGYWRALSPQELPDNRGWPGISKEYEGNSPSSMSQFIMHSA